ncbi:MAG: tRNA (adenosine(37)-N6)-threonylcarbamoyltransferase complex ATPase subunit type 1 TsaE [Bacteroidota bacterium]|nr:tRNA (adenosine(37)-N6)-threonylcarbamoyltransferase complex ATPase subunit type 1 TsaE [Bacteroidota bacterium]
MHKITIRSESELEKAARDLMAAYPDARVFAFYGKMGVGKTTFIRSICRLLGAEDIVQSPSFAIINEYLTEKGDSLYHFDFYRIRKLEEVYDLGYEDYFYSGKYCFIEWPELIESLLPSDVVRIMMEGEKDRIITY